MIDDEKKTRMAATATTMYVSIFAAPLFCFWFHGFTTESYILKFFHSYLFQTDTHLSASEDRSVNVAKVEVFIVSQILLARFSSLPTNPMAHGLLVLQPEMRQEEPETCQSLPVW